MIEVKHIMTKVVMPQTPKGLGMIFLSINISKVQKTY